MSNVIVDKNKIDILANVISNKSGEPVTMTLDEMVTAVDNIETGITPSGNLNITHAGRTDVTNYETVTVPSADVYPGYNDEFRTESGNRIWSITPYSEPLSTGWINNQQINGYEDVYSALPTNVIVNPSESHQYIGGQYYMMEDAIDVAPIPSNYVGSAVPRNTQGYPTATKGTVTNHSVSITPSVTNTTGYITGSTINGTPVTVTASELVSDTYTVDSSGTKNVTNYAYASVPSGTAGIPIATKGTVSNHSISVTPSVTNTGGWISGATNTGTPVTVTATELASGNKEITENGTNIDVVGYSTVSVNVSSQGSVTTIEDTTDASGGTIRTITTDTVLNLTSLNATQNQTYTAPSGTAYNEVVVNVSGGGSAVIEQKQVNFIDYDGTLVASKTAAEINAMTSDSDLPSNPSHTGLTAQGWNWTLAQLKAQLTAMPNQDITVGQMYITSSGDTEIDVRFFDSTRLSPILSICVNGTVAIDWGDGTSTDSVTGTSLTTRQSVSHTYSTIGDYTIIIHIVSGSFQFYGSNTSPLLRKNSTTLENRVYSNCVQNVRFGSGVTSIGDGAFYYCTSLSSVTIPSNITSIGNTAFYMCYSISSITIPIGVTSIEASTFYYCNSFRNSVSIPISVTSIGASAFSGCSCFVSITLPSGLISIGNNAFSNCYSLSSITIPSGVTSIGNSAFSSDSGMAEYHILPTNVPTLGTNAFSSISSDCIIYIPSSKLSDYWSASNWSAYTSYMQGE